MICVIILLRWLTTLFLRLSNARYDCVRDVSINRACKNDVSNPKKKQKTASALERR